MMKIEESLQVDNATTQRNFHKSKFISFVLWMNDFWKNVKRRLPEIFRYRYHNIRNPTVKCKAVPEMRHNLSYLIEISSFIDIVTVKLFQS